MKNQELRRQQRHSKPLWCTFLAVAILLVIQVSVVSAFEFDNMGRYDETSRTFTIRNSVLGIPFLQLDKVAEIKLNTPDVVHVIRGQDRKIAQVTVKNYGKDYQNFWKKMETFNIRDDMKELDREFVYKYKKSLGLIDVNDYETICIDGKQLSNGTILQTCHGRKLIGTHQEERFEWLEFDKSKDLPLGEITIGIFTDVYAGDKVEWIPTLFGVRIDEWATWTESFNIDLESYYNFEDTSSELIDVVSGINAIKINTPVSVPGLIGNGNFFLKTDIDLYNRTSALVGENGTMSLWINVSDTAENTKFIGKYANPGTFTMLLETGFARLSAYDSSSNSMDSNNSVPLANNTWHHIAFSWGAGGLKFWLNSVLVGNDSMTYAMNFSYVVIGGRITSGSGKEGGTAELDEIAFWSRALDENEIINLYNSGAGITYVPNPAPTVTLNSPVNAYNTTIPTIDFNCTASDDSGITNVSLVINGTIEQTNSSGINGTDYLFTETIATGAGFYNWSCIAFDDANSSTTADVRTFTYSNDLTVSLVSPAVNYNNTRTNITFNGSASDDTAIINVSLYIDGVLNETNSSGINETYYIFTKDFSDGDYNWTYEVCDVVSCLSATTRNFTIDTTPNIQFVAPTYANTTNSSSSYIPVNVSITETYFENITFNFYNGSLTSYFYTDSTRFINESFADGSYLYNVTVWTTTGQSNTTATRNITIDVTFPVINITYPMAKVDYHVINTSLNLNWTATDINLDACFYDYNGTNVIVTCSTNTTQINTTEHSNRNVTFYTNDTFGNLNSFYREWDYKIFENSNMFDEETTELSSETFSINISSDGDEILLGYLIYNSTSYIATKSGTDYNAEFNRTISLSMIGNVSFYWSFNYGGEILNSSLFYQNVSEILMGFCAGSLTTEVLNFTAYDEENRTRLTPYNFYGTFHYWLGDKTVDKNFSVSNITINETLICINVNETFYIDAVIQYEKSGYVKRNYYLINDSVTNVSANIDLFLLVTASSTSFIIDVIDNAQFSIANAYIYIQRYYAGIDEYETVAMALTDDSGSTVGHFETETEDYRIIIEVDGVIIYQSGTQKIFCRETPCTLSFQTEGDVGVTWEDFGIIDKFDWTLDFDEATNIWTLVYTDTSDSIGYGRLFVYYEKPDEGKITICNTTSTLLADTLTCDATGYNGTIFAKVYLSRSPEILVYLRSVIIGGLKAILGLEGLFLSMFVLMLLGFIGLWNPTVGIISVVGGMIILNFMGLASFGAVTIVGVIFIALIILWGLKS